MRRISLRLLRGSLTVAAPVALLTGCPDDSATTGSGSADSSSTGDSDSDPDTSAGPTTAPTTDQTGDTSTSDTVSTDTDTTDTDPTTDTGNQCGNGGIDGEEDCDGDELVGNDCLSLGFDDGTLACADDCTFDTSACVMYSCGNDAVEGREVCDGTDLAGEDCESQGFPLGGELGCADDCLGFDVSGCSANVCSNDVVEGDEVCDGVDVPSTCVDQGFDGGELACVDTCDAFDTSGCYACGDGQVGGPEQCDGDIGGATCVSLGFDGGVLACGDDCNYDTSQCFACGDGVLNGMETCDGQDFADPSICVDGGFDGGLPTCSADCSTVTLDSCFGLHTFCNGTDFAIGPAQGVVTVSDIAVAGLAGQITDVDVYMQGTHTYLGDLDITVSWVEPAATVGIASDECDTSENFDVTWDDEGAAFACGLAAPAFGGTMIPPDGDLASYEGAGDGNGTWRLSITDDENGDSGTLQNWCVEITTGGLAAACAFDTSLLPLNVHPFNHFGDFDFDGDCNIQMSGGFEDTLIEVDGVTGAVTIRAVFNGIDGVNGVAYRASDDTTYVATDFSALLFAVASDDSFVEVMALPELMNSIALAPETFGAYGNQLMGAGVGGGIWAIDPDNASAVSVVNLADNIVSDVVIDPSTNLLYAVTQNGNIWSMTPAGVTALVTSQAGVDGLAVDPGVALFFADPNAAQVTRYDLGNASVTNYPGYAFDGGYYTSGILVDGAGTVLTKVEGANLDFLIP